MTRQIEGLLWARPCQKPPVIPVGRPRGAKAAGLRYERELGKTIRRSFPFCSVLLGQWFEFEDSNGPGWCQPDIILQEPGRTIVLEAKYSWVPEAHLQLDLLYLPICQTVFRRHTVGVVVTRRLVPRMNPIWIAGDFPSALRRASAGLPSVLHWLPNTPLSQLASAVAA